MSSRKYIEQTVQNLGELIENVWTGKAKFEEVDEQYDRLRRHLYALAHILGTAPPNFLDNSEDLRKLWQKNVKGKLNTYDERRQFLANNDFVA